MPNEFNEYRAKKEGRVTAREAIENLLAAINRDEVEAVVFCARAKDDQIKTGWSDIRQTEAIGMLHCAQNEIMSDMYEE